jgi:hypothetical protein
MNETYCNRATARPTSTVYSLGSACNRATPCRSPAEKRGYAASCPLVGCAAAVAPEHSAVTPARQPHQVALLHARREVGRLLVVARSEAGLGFGLARPAKCQEPAVAGDACGLPVVGGHGSTVPLWLPSAQQQDEAGRALIEDERSAAGGRVRAGSV